MHENLLHNLSMDGLFEAQVGLNSGTNCIELYRKWR